MSSIAGKSSATKRRHSFREVRVHTGPDAARSAAALGATAYCVGRHLVFGAGRYEPDTQAGRSLLAHELVHCAQQRYCGLSIAQLAEVDEAALPAGITIQDSTDDINDHVKSILRRALSGRPRPSGTVVVERVYDELGDTDPMRPWLSLIELWTNSLPVATPTSPGKIYRTPQASTKYRGVTYAGWGIAGDGALAPLMRVNDILIGTDKIGHFFQLGYEYYLRSPASAYLTYGHETEMGTFGVGITGVYSRADQAANLQGMLFYLKLRRVRSGLFNIRNYVTEAWAERGNPNRYNDEVGAIVWRNLLDGVWQGGFTQSAAPSAVETPIRATLRTSDAVHLTGEFTYASPSGAVRGTIHDGTIRHIRDSNRLISGVQITYHWVSGTNSGQGAWESSGETSLRGTWGLGSSFAGAGLWQLTKTP